MSAKTKKTIDTSKIPESVKISVEASRMKKAEDISALGYESLIRFSSPRYQNNIVLFAKGIIESSEIRDIILETPLLKRQQKHYYLRNIKLPS